MIFLERLKLFKECPVCGSQLFPIIELTTESDNSYIFTLKNCEYPLVFGRSVPFGGEQEEIIINEGDIISVPKDIVRLMSKIVCSCARYKVEFCERFCFSRNENYPENTEPVESIYADKFMIKNCPPRTAIYLKLERTHPTDPLPRWYKKLFVVPYKPLSYWHVDDQNKFKEKLNKLLLLYDRK